MNTIVQTSKQIGLLTIALTIALVANFAYGQWANPTQVPTGGNVAPPINTSGVYQAKFGDFGAFRMRSDQYCDAAGNNCFNPALMSTTTTNNNSGGDTIQVAGRCYGPVDNVMIDGTARNIIEEKVCVPQSCKVRFISRVRYNNRTDVRTITQTSPSGLAAIYYWQHWDNNPPGAYGPTGSLAGDSWGGSWNDKSERAYTYYMDDTRQSILGAYMQGQVGNHTGYRTFPLVPGATASLVGWGSPYNTQISAEVLGCTPL
jgi:hypothetical protein